MIFICYSIFLFNFFEIPVPGGYAWDECVYYVPSDSHIYENNLKQTLVGTYIFLISLSNFYFLLLICIF